VTLIHEDAAPLVNVVGVVDTSRESPAPTEPPPVIVLRTVEQQNLPRTRNNNQRGSCSNMALFQGLTGEHEFSCFPNHYGSHHMHTSLAKAVRNEEKRHCPCRRCLHPAACNGQGPTMPCRNFSHPLFCHRALESAPRLSPVVPHPWTLSTLGACARTSMLGQGSWFWISPSEQGIVALDSQLITVDECAGWCFSTMSSLADLSEPRAVFNY